MRASPSCTLPEPLSPPLRTPSQRAGDPVSPTPVLHLVAGPNGAGKSTFVERILAPRTHLPFVNGDAIAAERWPGEEQEHAYDALGVAEREREDRLASGSSFITETVFSHPSRLALVARAEGLGFQVELHVVMVPVDVTAIRVAERVAGGGHAVPEVKTRARYVRMWPFVAAASQVATYATFYDNSQARKPFRVVASLFRGRHLGDPRWPAWAPEELTGL
jgi:predicted ABC-type ATPase